MNDKTNIQHLPVLLDAVVQGLAIHASGVYVDGTFGRGGHASAILEQLNSQGHLYAFDKDPEAVRHAHQLFSMDKRFTIFHRSFAELQASLEQAEVFGQVQGILLDLGVSSPQLDNPERGFSFNRKGRLDMRMDTSQGLDAKTWLATVDEKKLADVLWHYGEERFSRRIAKAIVLARQQQEIHTTDQLATIITRAMPRHQPGKHAATRSFQAIRIFINQELTELDRVLEQAFAALLPGGRLVVISFHSLEDRKVKLFIQKYERGEQEAYIPADLPIKVQPFSPRLKRIGSWIKPSEQEIAKNPRARSAILRIVEKLP
ncbi:MAG: 16S rRNA (cytosine(1402)-N(4))-methyltransferase [Gammaproteobacteria bacterium RIFCSPHIGHO2_12_FULL_41_20]|nr:MAG: 16S rRNA (cytosine(1402)-N(4))-methyltransferase [Gammaproteobacteria bacterium RIFCSPHIGHO2_12_FULL_41_20]